MSLVSILIPTYNNLDYLIPCVNSILLHQATPGLYDLILINNGDKGSMPPTDKNPEVRVIEVGENLGWEGGLKRGLREVKTEFVVFMNDDTYIPCFSAGWLNEMLEHFSDPKVAAVGPSSNCVMGPQNVFIPSIAQNVFNASFLIGFCVMIRRSALEEVGGVDDQLPYHGDDLDLSIRFRKAGYKLICDKRIFVYHHGFKTGGREFGSAWNSVEMTEKTNMHLIKKHGLKEFWKTISSMPPEPEWAREDKEGNVIRGLVNGGRVLDLACGDKKTVPQAVGVDWVAPGEKIPGLRGERSVADIVADVSKPLPIEPESYDTVIARHILEHMLDPILALKDWGKVVKKGGTLILAVPNQDLRNSIPMNYQHVHAYNPESLKNLMHTLGWHTQEIIDPKNEVSLIGVFSKNGLQ